MESIKGDLEIVAKLHLEDESNLICLEWIVENRFSKALTIYGYRLHFKAVQKDIVTRGIPDRFITNPHIVTNLWEGEQRSYLWKWVHPKYYGIKESGDWYYELQLRYRLEDEHEIQETDWIPSNELRISDDMLSIEIARDMMFKLREAMPEYLQRRFELKQKPRCLFEPRISLGLVPNQMCYTRDGWVAVIEYKKTATLETLVILNHYLQIAKEKYARGSEFAFGVIVAQYFDAPFLAKSEEFLQIEYAEISEVLNPNQTAIDEFD